VLQIGADRLDKTEIVAQIGRFILGQHGLQPRPNLL